MKTVMIAILLTLSSTSLAGTSLSMGFDTGYVRGYGFGYSNESMKHINLRHEFKNGWYANLWGAAVGIDYTVGHHGSLSEKTSYNVSLKLYDFVKLGESAYDSYAFIGTISHALTDRLQLGFTWEEYDAVQIPLFDGSIQYVSLTHALLLGNRLTITSHVRYGHDTSYGADEDYVRYSIMPHIQLSERMSATFLGITKWEPRGGADSQTVWTALSLNYTF